MGLKTCIIVDNSKLLDQWVEAFYNFTDLKESEIGIIKAKLFVTDKPVVIAMVQSLLSKIKGNFNNYFDMIDKAGFGLVIYDEVHNTSSAPQFAKSSILFRTPNIMGLSATPFQTGIAEVLMKNTVGEIIYETNKYDLVPEYKFLYYDSGLTNKYSRSLARVPDYLKRKAMYNSFIVKSEKYIEVVNKQCKSLLKRGHRVIILCFTKAQIQAISSSLENDGIVHRRFYGDEREVDKINDNVLVATYSFAGKGFDFAELSAMILACPLAGKKSLIQVCGRILRSLPGKQTPEVIDLVDLAFPTLSLPDIRTKRKIISEEFQCRIEEIKEDD